MLNIRSKDARGLTETSWLESHHSFSFSHYYDAAHMGFGPLRVINEDPVAPDTGFDTHGHKNMEIITYVLEGELAHKDSTGGGSVIRPGEVQLMSAGKGILHSEFNHSPAEPVHLLQIWIMPDEINTRPGYQQKPFPPEEMRNRFRLLVSKEGTDGSLAIKQDAKLFASRIDAGQTLSFNADSKRLYWLQVAHGDIELQGQALNAGDGIAIEKEQSLFNITARTDAEVLLFDLPQ